MMTIEWVSPKWGSMVKSVVVRSQVPLTFHYVNPKTKILIYVGFLCKKISSKHSPYDMHVLVEVFVG